MSASLNTPAQPSREPFAAPGPDAQYQQLLEQGSFCIQYCSECKQAVFYPRTLCPHCGSPDLQFIPASGTGEVYATTVQRRRPADGGNLNIAIITLAEGPRMMSRVEGIAPDEVRIGQLVRAEVARDENGPIVIFKLASA